MNGLLVVDKPAGVTSFDVVRELKKGIKGVKIGHLGTLDPLATGVLPILLGEGTKLAPFLEGGTKIYEATVHLGVTTDTQDKEGERLREVKLDGYDLSPQRIESAVHKFRGSIRQLPPMYSALKQKGKPLYKLARKGVDVNRRPREVEIYELRIMGIDLPYLHLHIECSKGTYIRTLANDIGEELGCGAHLAQLRRTKSGPFSLQDALSLEEIKTLMKKRELEKRILPLSRALDFLPAIGVGKDFALRIRQGQAIALEDLACELKQDEAVVRVLLEGEGGLVAVGRVKRGERGFILRPLRVFHDGIFTKPPLCGKNRFPKNTEGSGRKVNGFGRREEEGGHRAIQVAR
ncbi:MAG: tRNA pseudouridine(55) synthase TruB [Deltaproteobacteria bacterium]|nr:MAG: tRNA pseudouridine(55) synthase TruB [Deltaproteobacteria bacterium]